jgi:hypothetical protein
MRDNKKAPFIAGLFYSPHSVPKKEIDSIHIPLSLDGRGPPPLNSLPCLRRSGFAHAGAWGEEFLRVSLFNVIFWAVSELLILT